MCVFAAWALLVDDPLGGEPVVVVAVAVPPPKVARASSAVTAPAEEPPRTVPSASDEWAPVSPSGSATAGQTVTIIDGSTGKREVVAIPPTNFGGTGQISTGWDRSVDPIVPAKGGTQRKKAALPLARE